MAITRKDSKEDLVLISMRCEYEASFDEWKALMPKHKHILISAAVNEVNKAINNRAKIYFHLSDGRVDFNALDVSFYVERSRIYEEGGFFYLSNPSRIPMVTHKEVACIKWNGPNKGDVIVELTKHQAEGDWDRVLAAAMEIQNESCRIKPKVVPSAPLLSVPSVIYKTAGETNACFFHHKEKSSSGEYPVAELLTCKLMGLSK